MTGVAYVCGSTGSTLLNALAISQMPMNTSHNPPGAGCTELKWKPRISRTGPARMIA